MNKNVELPIGPAVKRRLGGRRQEDYAPSTEVERKPAQVPIGKSCPDGDPVNIYKHTRLVVCLAGRHNQRNNVQGLSVLEREKEKQNKPTRKVGVGGGSGSDGGSVVLLIFLSDRRCQKQHRKGKHEYIE